MNITYRYKKRKINIWVREMTEVIDIISNMRKLSGPIGPEQATSTASKTIDGPRVSPLGDHNIYDNKYDKAVQSSGAETTYRQILEGSDLQRTAKDRLT